MRGLKLVEIEPAPLERESDGFFAVTKRMAVDRLREYVDLLRGLIA